MAELYPKCVFCVRHGAAHYGKSRNELDLDPTLPVFIFWKKREAKPPWIASQENSEKEARYRATSCKQKQRKGGQILSEIKCILRGKLVFGGFAQSSLLPPPEFVVFGSGPWLNTAVPCFWPGEPAPPAYFYPVPEWNSRLSFLHCWCGEKHPGSNCGIH